MKLNRSQTRALLITIGGTLLSVSIILGFELGGLSALVSAFLGVWTAIIFVWVLRDEEALKGRRGKRKP
ncbi:MAG: hypothetical protein ACK4GT_15470 [Pararhodobacter sp.]